MNNVSVVWGYCDDDYYYCIYNRMLLPNGENETEGIRLLIETFEEEKQHIPRNLIK